jgi:hypothetical protein
MPLAASPKGRIDAVAGCLTMTTSPDALLRMSRARRQSVTRATATVPPCPAACVRRRNQPPATLVQVRRQGGEPDPVQGRIYHPATYGITASTGIRAIRCILILLCRA